jgi:hypothetical protein
VSLCHLIQAGYVMQCPDSFTPFFSPPMIFKFFCYDSNIIVVKTKTLRIVQSIWSEMHKNPLAIGVICDSLLSRKPVSKNLWHPWDIPGIPFGATTPSLGTTGLVESFSHFEALYELCSPPRATTQQTHSSAVCRGYVCQDIYEDAAAPCHNVTASASLK